MKLHEACVLVFYKKKMIKAKSSVLSINLLHNVFFGILFYS